MEPRDEERRGKALELLAAGDDAGLARYLDKLHPADVAEVVEALDAPARARLFAVLDDERAALVLEEADPETQLAVIRQLDAERAARIVQAMSSDDLADLLAEARPEEARDLLERMPAEEAADVRELLEYPEDTAGGLMTTEFLALQQDLTAEQAIEALRRLAPDAETVYYLYVVDPRNRLVGVLSLRDLVIAPPATPLSSMMKADVIAVTADTDQEEVARVVAKYDFLALPVVDAERRLLGIVTVDDVLDVVEEEATEDIARMTATAGEQDGGELGAWRRARLRLPWLLSLLVGELAAAYVIKGFTPTLEAMTALALFIPVMTGESGNAATQSLAVVVRGIATGDVEPGRIWRVVGREARVGFLSGAVTGTVLALATWAWQGNPALGLVIGLAMGLNMVLATVLGSFFPVVIDRLGIDPAVASGPFITTVTDVLSTAIYFSLATAFLTRMT